MLNAMMWPRPRFPRRRRFFCGNLNIIEENGRGGTALNPHLLLFISARNARKSAFDEKCRKLFAVHFGEDGEKVGLTAVGDPHFLAVENVMAAIGREIGPRFGGQGIGARVRFRQTVSRNHFGARKPGQVLLLLLFSAEKQQRHGADSRMRAMPSCERTVPRQLFRHHHRGRQIELHPAVALRRQDAFEAQRGASCEGALQPGRDRHAPLLRYVSAPLSFKELARRFSNGAMFFGQVFGRKNFARRLIFNEKESTRSFRCRQAACRHAISSRKCRPRPGRLPRTS